MTSPDGITWTARTSAVERGWYGVTWGGAPGAERFVAVAMMRGSGNRVMTSPDGISWTARTSPSDVFWNSVAWGGPPGQETFVATSDTGAPNQVMTSPNGLTWTVRSSSSSQKWRAVTWGGPAGQQTFVSVAYDQPPTAPAEDRVMTSRGAICTDITDAANSTYTVQAADLDRHLRVRVTASNGTPPDGVAYSPISGQVTGIPPTNDSPPSISGTPAVRETLTASPGTWSGSPAPTFTYQWQRCTTDSGSCTDITAAASATYVLQPADTGKYMRVKVTASNGVSPNADAYSPAPYPGPVAATASRTLYVNKYSPNRSSTPGCATPDFTEIGSADPTFSSGAVAAAVSGDTIHICGSPDAATEPLTATTGPYTPNVTLSTKSLTFVGDGPALTILDGEDNRTQFYADRHDAGQATSYLDLEAMTITRGRDINSGGAVQAICRDVEVTNVHFTDNQDLGFGDGGGAIHTWDGGCSGLADVTVTDSVFSGNIAARLADYGQSGSDGGAILAYGTVTVTDSVFEDNEARATPNSSDAARGGAIYAEDGISVTGSTFTGNSTTVGSGGAIYSAGAATVLRGTFNENVADSGSAGSAGAARGGAILATGIVSITESSFEGNSASAPTGMAGGGAIYGGTRVQISDSSFLANSVVGDDSYGGAVFAGVGGARSTVDGSTFAGNEADDPGSFGGAFRASSPGLDATNSTFTGNSAGAAPALSSSDDLTVTNVTVSANPGTFDLDAGGVLRIGNSIVDETGEACRAPLPASTYKVSLGGNVIANTTASDCDPFVGGGGAPATKVTSASIALQALADNGGPTETMALGLASVARTSAGVNLLGAGPEDQRGMARPASSQSTLPIRAPSRTSSCVIQPTASARAPVAAA